MRDQVTWACGIVVFPSNLDVCDSFMSGSERYAHSNTVVHAMDGVLLLGSLRMRWNIEKALLSEEKLLVRVNKASKRASETR